MLHMGLPNVEFKVTNNSEALIDLGYFFILRNAVNASAALFSFI